MAAIPALLVAMSASTAPPPGRLLSKPRLDSLKDAQRTAVHRVPQFLDSSEIEALLEAATHVKRSGEGEQDLHRRQGCAEGTWSTVFLNHHLASLLPDIHAKLFAAARGVDATHWGLLDEERHELNLRCVEYHTVTPGGGIPMREHHDYGSLLTLDVMLSEDGDFEGGDFCTPEADGSLAAHPFERGDLLLFHSHKYHMVQPVTRGRRQVLVAEIWEGLPRRCRRRCRTPWGACVCAFAPPPPRYVASAGQSAVKPCLRLMSKSEDQLDAMAAQLAVDPAAADEWQTVGAHAQWLRRRALDREVEAQH